MKPVFLLLLLCIVAGTGSAEIDRWVDSAGKVHFSDQPSEELRSESLERKINTFESATCESLNFVMPEARTNKKVIMYSASWCGVYARAKRYFERERIPYTELDVETSEQGRRDFERLDGKGGPIILVGSRRMNGFSVAGFKQLYR